MRISFRTKKRRLLFATGEDTESVEPEGEGPVYIQLSTGDFTPVAEEEVLYEEEEAEERGRGFGFSS